MQKFSAHLDRIQRTLFFTVQYYILLHVLACSLGFKSFVHLALCLLSMRCLCLICFHDVVVALLPKQYDTVSVFSL